MPLGSDSHQRSTPFLLSTHCDAVTHSWAETYTLFHRRPSKTILSPTIWNFTMNQLHNKEIGDGIPGFELELKKPNLIH